MATDRRVRLNIGGRVFETYLSTLQPSGFFRAKFGGNWSVPDNNEDLFIDRDFETFGHLLAFLRNPNYKYPHTEAMRDEFDFYAVDHEENIEKL